MDHLPQITAEAAPPEAMGIDFRVRWTGTELMDDPACDEAMLIRTLDQFRSINRLVSRYRTILTRWVLDDMAVNPERNYHLIDLGAGGCDIPVWLLGEARRRKLSLRVTALDGDARAVAYARRNHGHVEGLQIRHADILAMSEHGPADYLFTNHVLHHLPDDVVVNVLKAMHQTARRRWIVSDLQRSRWAYLGFQLLGRCYRHSFAFEDGKRSIRRGFRSEDFNRYVKQSEIEKQTRIVRLTPGRMLLIGDT